MSVKRVTPTDWTRRGFVRDGRAAASAMALGGCAHTSAPPSTIAEGATADLDRLAGQIRGRFLRDGSPRKLVSTRCDPVWVVWHPGGFPLARE